MYAFRSAALLLLCFGALLGLGSTTISVKIRCSDDLTIYADGTQKGSATNTKNSIKTYSIPDDTSVVAVQCVASSSSVRGGIFASFNSEFEGDYVTDNTWRCSNTYSANWFSKSFDDSIWNYAVTSNKNSAASKDGLTSLSSYPDHVNWIWTPSHTLATGDTTVYCRGYPKVSPTYDSYGRRFVVAFMDNNRGSPRKDIKLLFTTLIPTDVTVFCKTPRLASSNSLYVETSLTVKSGEVKIHTLPRDLRHYDTSIKDYGLLCLATQPVKIIGINQEMYSTDMCLMIPLTSLGSSTTQNTYYTVNWDASSDARVVIAAGYDGTTVKVKSPKTFNYASSSRSANSEITINLSHKYKTVQLTASGGFTGTRIISNKPVIVYTGNKKAAVRASGSGSSSDHLVEQLQPKRTHGKHFIITPLPYSSSRAVSRIGTYLSQYKIIASEDSTTITIKRYNSNGALQSGGGTYTKNAGQYVDYTHTRGYHAIVESNKGIQVAQFATTMASGGCMGDPWLQMIPPSGLYSRDYGLLTPALVEDSTCPPKHYVTIIIKKTEKDGIRVNGNAVSWTSAVDIATTDKVYLTVNIPYQATTGQRVEHTKTSVSFGVYFFGYGKFDSYATMGGTRMVPINEPCSSTTPTSMGDGIDNDCDGQIDEDQCTSFDASKDCGLPNPINGGWSAWAAEGSCGCGANINNPVQTYKRLCNNPVPRYNGWPCPNSDTKTESCTCVKVDGGWSGWGSWSQCSQTCDTGTRSRTRSCTSPYPSTYPVGADCPGSRTGTESCRLVYCPINGGWSAWSSPTTQCVTNQRNGVKTFTRTCTNPSPQHGGNNCAGSTTMTQTHDCSIDGGWSAYSAWSSCTRTCGTGSKTRTRTCTNPAPQYAGANCVGSTSNTQTCNTNPCPINGGWTSYSSWSTCTKSCATGTQTRTRSCTNPAPQHGGNNCAGVTSTTQNCNTHNCPIHGGWSAWATNNVCVCPPKSGDGAVTHTRTCTNPTPQYNGNNCAGSNQMTTACTCVLDGEWAAWGSYGSCSVTCGDGTKSRSRTCTDPAPENGGLDCPGQNSSTATCNDRHCPINGGFGSWSSWLCDCTEDVYNGTSRRSRACDNPEPQYGGLNCSGDFMESRYCDCLAMARSNQSSTFSVDYTRKTKCSENPHSRDNSTLGECLGKCAVDSNCTTIVFQQIPNQHKCLIMHRCTEVNATTDSVVFIKDIPITTTTNSYDQSGSGAQGGDANAGNANAQNGQDTTAAAAAAGSAAVAAVAAATILVVIRRRKKKKEQEELKDKIRSTEADDVDVEDLENNAGNSNEAQDIDDNDW